MRHWQLEPRRPFAVALAADARLRKTDYRDDQIWEVLLGAGESPALALQTRYGGRAGLVSVAPIWFDGGRAIYQTQAFREAPTITAFEPGYLRVEGKLTQQLALTAEYIVFESHAIGGRFTLENGGTQPAKIRLELIAQVIINQKEMPLKRVILATGDQALGMGRIGNLSPILLMESGKRGAPESDNLGRSLAVRGGKKARIEWVHAARPEVNDSLALAQRWLGKHWPSELGKITRAADAIPAIETGNPDWDAAIAYSYRHLVGSFLHPTASLPEAFVVATRRVQDGFGRRGDDLEDATTAYLAALAMAAIEPEMAQGIVINYLARQGDDGWIGGLSGQMCLPLLARLAWGVYQYTVDTAFLREVFAGLLGFFERWFGADLDRDEDGLPEWQSEEQSGYTLLPTFAVGQAETQNADIRFFEGPGMAAYLLSEARSLVEIAEVIGETTALAQIEARQARLGAALEELWDDLRYTYRDFATHTTAVDVKVLSDGEGDQEHGIEQTHIPPSRLLVRITGGVDHAPRMTLHIEGLDNVGEAVEEVIDGQEFVWQRGRGVYTSRRVFERIDRIWAEGLSRVYRIDAQSVDMTRLDINALLPLWSASISDARAARLAELLSDPAHFWSANGIIPASAQDAATRSAHVPGFATIRLFWQTILGEGLLEYGYGERAFELLKRLLDLQATVLHEQGAFFEYYHREKTEGLGMRGHLKGIVPLHLLLRTLDVRIRSAEHVWVGAAFAWRGAVTVRQHDVTVVRSPEGTQINFPSGYTVELAAGETRDVHDMSLSAGQAQDEAAG